HPGDLFRAGLLPDDQQRPAASRIAIDLAPVLLRIGRVRGSFMRGGRMSMADNPSRRNVLGSAGLAGLAIANPTLAASTPEGLGLSGLMAENVVNPVGVQLGNVRLSWRLETVTRGTMQGAYQVQVASSAANLKAGVFDLWDSGKIASDQSFDIAYG